MGCCRHGVAVRRAFRLFVGSVCVDRGRGNLADVQSPIWNRIGSILQLGKTTQYTKPSALLTMARWYVTLGYQVGEMPQRNSLALSVYTRLTVSAEGFQQGIYRVLLL
jgi:hypothetical protein